MGDNQQTYKHSSSVYPLEDDFDVRKEYKMLVKDTVVKYPYITFGLIVVLILIIGYMWWTSRESFMPTSLMKYQQLEHEALDASSATAPAMAAGNAQATFFQNAVQGTGGGQFTIDPSAAPGQPGSLGYQILNSPDFGCSSLTPTTNNAWQWMIGQLNGTTVAPPATAAVSAAAANVQPSSSNAPESFMNASQAAKNDKQLSAVLAGY